MKILITGSAGQLAKALIPKLLNDPNVEYIIGIDLQPRQIEHPRLHHHIVDIRSQYFADYLEGIDCVIHLAFVMLRQKLREQRFNRALIYDINVNGSINVFSSVARKGIRHLTYLSSAIVYGAWPKNPFMMDESHHRRPMPGYSYSEDKIAVENWLDQMGKAQNTCVVRFRPALIVGPNMQPFYKYLLSRKYYPFHAKPPLTQCVWEDDVVDAICMGIARRAEGSFNLATTPAVSLPQLLKYSHRLVFPVPQSLLKIAQNIAWKIFGIGEPNWQQGYSHSLTIDSKRAREVLGWQPSRSSEDCIRELFKIDAKN